MTGLTILAGLLVAVVGCWLIVESHRSHQARQWLFGAIPVLLAWPVAIHFYGSSLLGYATPDQLGNGFILLHAFADDKRQAVFATVRLKGEEEPRLYVVTSNFDKARKAFAQAQLQVDKGLPVVGDLRQGAQKDDGVFVFYNLPPAGLPEKDGPNQTASLD